VARPARPPRGQRAAARNGWASPEAMGEGRGQRAAHPVRTRDSSRSASWWRLLGARPAIRPGRLTGYRPIAGQDTIT